MKNTQTFKQGILLLGSFNIAYDLANFFHELSHGLAAIITGGTFSDMVINPFSWSYCYSSSPNQLAHTSAGALGAILIAGVIYLVFYWKANPWLLPLLLIAPMAMMENGTYYIIDIIMNSRGDACRLVGMGIHPAILIFLGVICVIIGLILAVLLVRKMSLFLFDFKGRLFVLGLGFFPSTLAMLVWNWVYNRNELLLWTVYTVVTIVLTFIFAMIPKRIWETNTNKPLQLKWKTVIIINLVYIGLLVFWFVGPFSVNNVLGIEKFSERPEDFPPVMTASDFSKDKSYFRPSGLAKAYFLSYSFSESISPDQITDFISNLHKENGYIRLTHSIYDPNEILCNDWEEKTEQFNGVMVKTKQSSQMWLKVAQQPLESLVFITYVWKKDNFEDAYVIHKAIEYPEYEQLYNYATIHPEQFDPNQIEQLKVLSLEKKEILKEPASDKDDSD